jgi:hypothetical protein
MRAAVPAEIGEEVRSGNVEMVRVEPEAVGLAANDGAEDRVLNGIRMHLVERQDLLRVRPRGDGQDDSNRNKERDVSPHRTSQ